MFNQLRTRITTIGLKPNTFKRKHFGTIPEYPGLGLPLRNFPQEDYGFYPMGTHGNCWGGDSSILPVRELAMMSVMEKLTDKDNWHKKVFDNEIIAKWRKEALEYPDDLLWKLAIGGKMDDWRSRRSHLKPLKGIMSNEAFDYCVQELRNKARYYEESGLIPTLDASASVVKSDILVSSKIQYELRNAFDKLRADQKASPDWHPNSNDMVQDLIHPSMYPLVYDRSKVLRGEVVGVTDAIETWAGKGEIILKSSCVPSRYDSINYSVGGTDVPPNFWSDTYQWLPSNVAFQNDGSVKFTSYINNLHPNKYPDIYRTIEKLVQTALPAWDQCLALAVDYNEKRGVGRVKSRFSQPENPDDENLENWDPSDPEAVANVEVKFEDDGDQNYFENETERKWHKLRKPVQLQPDIFEDGDGFYTPGETERLSEKFKDSGLQIIVKMASIELTPEKPEFPAGGWHVEGQMNERICATALYYLDSTNISPSTLSFRMQTSAYLEDDYDVGQDAYHWMEQIYGTRFGCSLDPCLQNYGSVETREGRLLAFPNVFQHRVSPFRLTDPTKPGHRRFIALWLVDPHARIISTANVPPQQQTWWSKSLFSPSSPSNSTQNSNISKLPAELAQLLQKRGVAINSGEKSEGGKLPPEIMEVVCEYFNMDRNMLLMSEVEAKEHREKLMEVRAAFHVDAEGSWHARSYSFCEH